MGHLLKILPEDLTGPRSFFTDIDSNDKNYDQHDALRKLKLQLLTKEKVVVPASSMFDDVWFNIFMGNKDLIPALDSGILIPAIRDQFDGVGAFFEDKKYGDENKAFYLEHVNHSIPWNLTENTEWFHKHFTGSLIDSKSVLRTKGNINKQESIDILYQLNALIENESPDSQFLQRKHIELVSSKQNEVTHAFLTNYANLIYRLSGSRVVNSEGHFPQSNLTKLNLVGNEQVLSDESLFWDIYAETVFSFLGTAIRLTPERLDNMSFSDILMIRKSFFDIGFTQDYDKLINSVKQETSLLDPDKLILHMHEISSMAQSLKCEFESRVKSELLIKDNCSNENALWQVANVISLLASPGIGIAIGTLSALNSIPEITAPISSNLSNSLKTRFNWLRNFVNQKIGWSEPQRRTFLDAYRELAIYGLKQP
jgi:hypothetical protein